MAQRAKVKDLVIVVPGMLGSRLVQNRVPLWGDGSPTFLAWARRHGDDLARLSIGADDPELDDLGDGIVADGAIDGVFVVGRFLRVGGYGPFLAALQKHLTLKAGENLQVFAYDWRRDLEVAARRLAVKADGWLKAWRARSGNPRARIALVGHGMGGLVARYYADVLEGWREVGKLITIGTPFQGSVRALDLLYFGADFQNYGLSLHDVTPIARTFTSVYELLPRYPSIHTFTGEVVSPFEVRIPTFEQQKMDRSKQFHRNLADHHARNRAVDRYAELEATAIVGVGQPTVERARLLANGTLSVESDPRETTRDGDGVVPRFSAESSGAGSLAAHSIYLPQTHACLLAHGPVQAHLHDRLGEPAKSAPPPASPLPRLTIRRTVTDQMRLEVDALSLCILRPFARVGQTVEIRVRAGTATGHPFDARSCRIDLRVEQVAAIDRKVRPVRVKLVTDREHPGWFVGRLKAPAAGTYLATAMTKQKWLAAFPVGDYFEVDAGR